MSQKATQFNHVTRDNGGVKGKSRIYFSCHKDDKEKYLNKTCKDLFSVLDCVIYYTDDMEADYSEELRHDLEQMNLFVIPVTRELLFSECRTVNVDMHYAIEKGIPMKRMGTIEEIGKLAAFLASDEASYITGQGIVIDGGSTLPETMIVGE